MDLDEESSSASSAHVVVAVRCRPLNDRERQLGSGQAIKIVSSSAVSIKHRNEEQLFKFDHVFGEEVSQEHIFQTVGQPQLDKAFEGYNSTIFAYGQTGSGKTHTMMNLRGSDQERGLIPRISTGLFARMANVMQKHSTRRFLVQCSFLEIYNEVIYDLLAPRSRQSKGVGLEVREQKGLGIYVKDLTEAVVEDPQRLERLLTEGFEQRATAATKMNDASSRSHCVFTIKIHQKDAADSSKNTISKLNLVDLAGSERAKQTETEGIHLKEGANINKSLSALGNVINALSSSEGGKRRAFVPYRDSKLTRVLQESLGGNALCTMVAAISPAESNAEETLSTLNYAKRAKTIRVDAKRNEESSEMQKLEKEVEALRLKLLQQEGSPGGLGLREQKEIEARHKAEIEALEAFMRQSWEDKQRLSEQHEEERRKARLEAQRAAEQVRGEQRRRLQLLEQSGDLHLTLKTLSALTGAPPIQEELCPAWPERLATALRLQQQLQAQLRTVHLYRESAGSDLAAFWQQGKRESKDEEFEDPFWAAATLISQVIVKLDSMRLELEPIRALETLLQEEMGRLLPEVAVALHQARASVDEIKAIERDAEVTHDHEAEQAAEERAELMALVHRQLSRHYAQEGRNLREQARQLGFAVELGHLAERLAALASSSKTEAGGEGQEATAKSDKSLKLESLLAELRAAAMSAAVQRPEVEGALDVEPELPVPVGLATLQFPTIFLRASSNEDAAACARLMRTLAFGGWAPGRDSAEEFLEVDLAGAAPEQVGASRGPWAVVGVTLQGRLPATGNWSQTLELLRAALGPEEAAIAHANERTFVRPPVRCVHEVAVALVHQRSCFGEGGWRPPAELLAYQSLAKEQKLEFFSELIRSASKTLPTSVPHISLSPQDILAGRKCEETNRLLQVLAYSLLRQQGRLRGGLVDVAPQWITAWRLQYLNAAGWKWLEAPGGGPADMEGCCDDQTPKYVALQLPANVQKIRVHPVAWHCHPGLRLEVNVVSTEKLQGDAPVSLLGPAGGGIGEQLEAQLLLTSRASHVLKKKLEARRRAGKRQQTMRMEKAEQERGELAQRLEEALARAERLEARAAAAEASLLHARAENERLQAMSQQSQRELEAANEAKLESESIGPRLREEVAQLMATVEDLSEQLLVVTDERDVARRHEEELFEVISAKDDQLLQAKRDINDLTQQLREKEVEGEAADLLESEMSEMQSRLQEMQAAQEEAVANAERMQEAHQRALVACKALEEENQSLKSERDRLQKKKEKLQAKLDVSEQARRAARERAEKMFEKLGDIRLDSKKRSSVEGAEGPDLSPQEAEVDAASVGSISQRSTKLPRSRSLAHQASPESASTDFTAPGEAATSFCTPRSEALSSRSAPCRGGASSTSPVPSCRPYTAQTTTDVESPSSRPTSGQSARGVASGASPLPAFGSAEVAETGGGSSTSRSMPGRQGSKSHNLLPACSSPASFEAPTAAAQIRLPGVGSPASIAAATPVNIERCHSQRVLRPGSGGRK